MNQNGTVQLSGLLEAVLRLEESDAEAVPSARAFTRATLDEWGTVDVLDDVVLVVSELVTNGLLHAGPPLELRLRRNARTVRVEVHDTSVVAPVRPLAGTDSMTGRGIALVDALSRRWGFDRLPDGKRVWSEVGLSTAEEPPGADIEALLAAWGDAEDLAGTVTVELGDVPTDLLLAAKGHVDNLVREFTLAATGEAAGTTAAVPEDLARLINTVVHRFSEARQSIKRQALAAAGRGQPRVTLTLTLTPAAIEAGRDYLDALDQADAYARDARLLTLETPAQHRVFRNWYVEALIDQVREVAPGQERPAPSTFEQRLLSEFGRLSAVQRRTADQFAADRWMSESLQRSLLTDPPQQDQLQIVVRYRPAPREAQIGGDWYDAFPNSDGSTSLVIGDVTGHDREAAAAMGQVRNLLRGIAYALRDPPAAVLTALDRALRDLPVSALATAVLATVEQAPSGAVAGPRRLRWSNAGHLPPLLIDADGSARLLRTDADLLLGVDPATQRSDLEQVLQPGATVLLFTDGLVERRGASIDDGLDWLLVAARRLGPLTLDNLCDALLEEVGDRGDDDLALLAVRAHDDDRKR